MSAFNPEDESIHAWLMRYIQRQAMVENLEWIAEQIKADCDDGYEYTKDKAKMAELRECFKAQMEHARQEQ